MDSTTRTSPRDSDIINETAATAQTAPNDSRIINELLSRVTHGFDSPNTPRDSEIITQTAAMGNPWIRQCKQPLGTQKSSTKVVSRVTHGFNSANST
ncbi:hypothetical protein Peur_008419 [Populus x canadensis]